MRSLYEDVFSALEDTAFSIPNVTVRKPYDESPKTYPALVVHEIVNMPASHSTVTGEGRTALSYQVDILTQNCVDTDGAVLGRYDAGRRLVGEVTDALEALKVTRRTITPGSVAADVMEHIWRGDCVYDSDGFSYRK